MTERSGITGQQMGRQNGERWDDSARTQALKYRCFRYPIRRNRQHVGDGSVGGKTRRCEIVKGQVSQKAQRDP